MFSTLCLTPPSHYAPIFPSKSTLYMWHESCRFISHPWLTLLMTRFVGPMLNGTDHHPCYTISSNLLFEVHHCLWHESCRFILICDWLLACQWPDVGPMLNGTGDLPVYLSVTIFGCLEGILGITFQVCSFFDILILTQFVLTQINVIFSHKPSDKFTLSNGSKISAHITLALNILKIWSLLSFLGVKVWW